MASVGFDEKFSEITPKGNWNKMNIPPGGDIIDLTDSPPSFPSARLESEDELEVSVASVTTSIKRPSRQKRKNSSADDGSRSKTRKNGTNGEQENHGQPETIDLDQADGTTHNINDSGTTDIFYVDLQPAPLKEPQQLTPQGDTQPRDKLLLPAHVSVLGSVSVEILPTVENNGDDDDFIDYLDVEDIKEIVRYFETPPDESTVPNRTICKNCGAEGEHKTSACPVLICLTCGVRNEHHTRSCPISKVCFTCGMKGHINANCPNRRSAKSFTSGRFDDCDRCGSGLHKTNECPTWWRLYEYFTDEEKAITIERRQSKKLLQIGQGGEGYIADDEWCYNCGCSGHWGDDCQERTPMERPRELSAFSANNVMSGPFYDPSEAEKRTTTRRNRSGSDTLGDWGIDAPDNVGRQARKKAMDRLAKKEQDQYDDTDDWFNNNKRHERLKPQETAPKRLSFGKSIRPIERSEVPSTTSPSLLSRLGDKLPPDSRSKGRDRGPRSSDSTGSRSRNGHRNPPDWNDHSDRHWRGPSRDRRDTRDLGPRYRGGYARHS